MNSVFLLILICLLVAMAIVLFCFCKPRKWFASGVFIGLTILLMVSFVTGHIMGYIAHGSVYPVDNRLISSIAYIKAYQYTQHQLPGQDEFNAWLEDQFQDAGIIYYNELPELEWHKANWGKAGEGFIVGVFNGDGEQYYTSYKSRFYYKE